MPVDAHEKSFGYKHSLTNWGKIEASSPFQLVYQHKIFQSNLVFLGNEFAPVQMFLEGIW